MEALQDRDSDETRAGLRAFAELHMALLQDRSCSTVYLNMVYYGIVYHSMV